MATKAKKKVAKRTRKKRLSDQEWAAQIREQNAQKGLTIKNA